MTQVLTKQSRTGQAAGVQPRAVRQSPPRWVVLAMAGAAIAVAGAALYPSLHPGFWSWDWYWIDQHAHGNTDWGGPFYDVANHANPLPAEVQWYRLTLAVFGLNPFAHHLLTLVGMIATAGVLYLLLRRLGIPRWAGVWAAVLAAVAPASLTSWTWFAASPHMWAALLGLSAMLTHLMWRQGGSPAGLLALAPPALSILGLGMKNDAVIGPLLILAWEWSRHRTERPPGRAAVTIAAILPMAAFVWWQATADDPHRDQAETGLGQVFGNIAGLLRFAFLWRSDAELRAEFPPAAAAPVALVLAGALVGALVLLLAAVSLRTRSGQVLVAAGLASLGPIAVLQPALLSRYVLPPVLLATAAAAAGAAHLAYRAQTRHSRAAIAGVALATVAIWGSLAHLASGAGSNAVREEQALLAGLIEAGLAPGDEVAVRLVNSPVEPSTASLRQFDPALPPKQRLQRLRFLLPGEDPPRGMRVATATRLATGTYLVVLMD